MISLTPAADAVASSLKKYDEVAAQHLTEGASPEVVVATRKILGATLESFATLSDAGTDANMLIEVMSVAIANSLATFIGTFAQCCDQPNELVAEDFLLRLFNHTETALAQEPLVKEESNVPFLSSANAN